MRADAFAFSGRRQKKRHFRQLWIARLSAASQAHGLLYSRFINGVQKAGIKLNRKELSELAIHDPDTFSKLVDQAKAALA
jgi:large subunit ribosomal protein L20